MSLNKWVGIGNLCGDPQLTTTTNGISVCRFTLAVQRKFANESGEKEADFIPIVVWRAQGENCYKYLKKGSKAGVAGSIQTRTYDAQDGTKRYTTEVIAEEVEFLTSKQGQETSKPEPSATQTKFEPIDDDNLPF